ncbi:hypothetical protein FACS1894105_09150 [Clostridia bacterium]|nr:hypothetical protein FACS1894105_09150 [Clostridia bacterium]
MKIKYIGESFYIGGLTNGNIYECLGVRNNGAFGDMLLVIDDDQDDWNYDDRPDWEPGYLYSLTNPAPLDGSSPGGRWEIVEDDENGTLAKAMCLARQGEAMPAAKIRETASDRRISAAG